MADSLLRNALHELELAHLVIRNALNLMTPEQKNRWADQNKVNGCDGEGTTRANKRSKIIAALLVEMKRVDEHEAQTKEISGEAAGDGRFIADLSQSLELGLSQLRAMLSVTYGSETFRELDDDIQDLILWGLHDKAQELEKKAETLSFKVIEFCREVSHG